MRRRQCDVLVSYALGPDGAPILRMVEFNFGTNSGFITFMDEAPESILRMGEFLASYPERVASGELKGGMTPREQIRWLKRKLRKWGVDPVRDLDGFIFTEDQLSRGRQ